MHVRVSVFRFITILLAVGVLFFGDSVFHGGVSAQFGGLLGGSGLSLQSVLSSLDPALAQLIEDSGIDETQLISLLLNEPDWPDRLENHVNPIEEPELTVEISESYMDSIFTAFTSQPIPFPIGNSKAGIAFGTTRFQLHTPFSGPNVISIMAEDGIVRIDGAGQQSFNITNATLQLAPQINMKNDRLFIDFYGRLTYVEIKGLSTRMNKMLAAILASTTEKKPIISIDITDYIALEKTVSIMGQQRTISLIPDKTAVTVKDDYIRVDATFADGGNSR
jgi:hypothetical protein